MFYRISYYKKAGQILLYNEKKVSNETASLIQANGFLNDKDRLTYQDKFYRFKRQNELNPGTKTNMLHITLSFDSSIKLVKNEMVSIADKYMEGIGFKDQPYLVYEHYDAGHPHLHIVTNVIRQDGSHIRIYKLGHRLSNPVCRKIDAEFGLMRGEDNRKPHKAESLTPEYVQKLIYGDGRGTKKVMQNILQFVNNDYKFKSLVEYNAILRQYNVTAERGSPESFLYQKRGLLYFSLDDTGKRIGAPIKASDFDFKPTLSYLDKKFEDNREHRKEDLSSIQKRIDWSLSQHATSLRDFVQDLRNGDIELAVVNNVAGEGSNLIYIDNRSRTAVNGSDLGREYEAKTVLENFHLPEKVIVPGINWKVSQILSDVLERDQSFAQSSQELREEQKIQHRHHL